MSARVAFYHSPMLGNMNSPEGFTSLLTDVSERLFGPLPDATWVYQGHGNDTTLGTTTPRWERSARTSASGANAAGEARAAAYGTAFTQIRPA